MPAKTAKQRAAQERFRAAAKQAKREGKKGKSFARRVGELLKGHRASHGAGHKTKSGGHSKPSYHSSGGGSTAGHKPKPRIAVYAGAAGSVILAAGKVPNIVPHDVTLSSKGSRLSEAAANVAAITTDLGTAAEVATPALAGGVVSILADWFGLNKRLAKMRAPWRI